MTERRMMKRLTIPLVLAFVLTGCGLTQSVSDGTKSVANAIFYKRVKTLRLDLQARGALNPDEDGMPLATDVWIYQLKDRQAFDKADYKALQSDAHSVLGADILAEKDIYLRPGSTLSVDMPLDEKAEFVAVVAQFRNPDARRNDWRTVLTRDELDPDKARTLVLEDDAIALTSPDAQ